MDLGIVPEVGVNIGTLKKKKVMSFVDYDG